MTTTNDNSPRRPRWLLPMAALGTLFGIATIIAGGRVIFGSAAARAAEGDYVPFVLWFNFLAGFAYVAAGVALALGQAWGARLALAIAVGSALVFAAFGVHVLLDGPFTRHTVMAMTVRTLIWFVIAVVACRHFGCTRTRRMLVGTVGLIAVLVGVTTCGRPPTTVKVHAADSAATKPAATTTAASPQRRSAPRMSVKDHKDRDLELPVPGRVTVLSFASRQTADRGSERCREVRVAHPDIEIVELMNVSSAPSFMANKVKGKLAERHDTIVADTTRAFSAAQKAAPANLEARIHIIADWNGDAFKAYGATNTEAELQMAVIDGDGGIVEFFATTPMAADLSAAVVRANTAGTPR